MLKRLEYLYKVFDISAKLIYHFKIDLEYFQNFRKEYFFDKFYSFLYNNKIKVIYFLFKKNNERIV